MSIPPTPFPAPGQDPNWANQLINAITDRDALTQAEVDALTTLVDSGRLSQAALQDAYAARTTVDTLQTLVDDGRLSETALADEFAARSHTHPIGQVDGLTDALDGKQPAGQYVAEGDPRLSDAREPLAHRHPLGDLDGTGATGLALLATALPADARDALGITVDTSVGTRVFIGDVMVHGDTGWRDISADIEDGFAVVTSTNYVELRRENSTVSLRAWVRNLTDEELSYFYTFPSGFRPLKYGLLGHTRVGGAATGIALANGSTSRLDMIPPAQANNNNIQILATFSTPQDWPTALPGTPA